MWTDVHYAPKYVIACRLAQCVENTRYFDPLANKDIPVL